MNDPQPHPAARPVRRRLPRRPHRRYLPALLLLGALLHLATARAAILPGLVEKGDRSSASRDASVDNFLDALERASLSNDADRKSELYAEQVDRYFLRTGVTRQFVAHDLLAWLSTGRLITSFRITVLSDTGGPAERTLLVRKQATWIDPPGRGGSMPKALTVRSQLILHRFGGAWKIVSERDYKS